MYGRPGAVYIDIPGNLVLSSIEEDQIPLVFARYLLLHLVFKVAVREPDGLKRLRKLLRHIATQSLFDL